MHYHIVMVRGRFHVLGRPAGADDELSYGVYDTEAEAQACLQELTREAETDDGALPTLDDLQRAIADTYGAEDWTPGDPLPALSSRDILRRLRGHHGQTTQ